MVTGRQEVKGSIATHGKTPLKGGLCPKEACPSKGRKKFAWKIVLQLSWTTPRSPSGQTSRALEPNLLSPVRELAAGASSWLGSHSELQAVTEQVQNRLPQKARLTKKS